MSPKSLRCKSMRRKSLATTFCHCIKKVRSTVTLRKGLTRKMSKNAAKESAAIAICVRSVLQKRGKTLKKFKCRGKPYLVTQPRIKN